MIRVNKRESYGLWPWIRLVKIMKRTETKDIFGFGNGEDSHRHGHAIAIAMDIVIVIVIVIVIAI